MVDLGGSNEEGEGAAWREAGCGDGEDLIEALDCAQDDEIGRGGREVLGAPGEYIDARQCKGADDFAEERDLLLAGFDKGDKGLR